MRPWGEVVVMEDTMSGSSENTLSPVCDFPEKHTAGSQESGVWAAPERLVRPRMPRFRGRNGPVECLTPRWKTLRIPGSCLRKPDAARVTAPARVETVAVELVRPCSP
ncbi:hypothetical protein GCM10010350_60420 [Streptomyces galilaeus]|nr:hypothetical protein GCM10010350_60420 [Streptomyces galilaeus]